MTIKDNNTQLEHIYSLIESLEDAVKCAMVDDELIKILAPISLSAARMREHLVAEEANQLLRDELNNAAQTMIDELNEVEK